MPPPSRRPSPPSASGCRTGFFTWSMCLRISYILVCAQRRLGSPFQMTCSMSCVHGWGHLGAGFKWSCMFYVGSLSFSSLQHNHAATCFGPSQNQYRHRILGLLRLSAASYLSQGSTIESKSTFGIAPPCFPPNARSRSRVKISTSLSEYQGDGA